MSKLRRQMSANTASVVETKSLIEIKAKTGNLYESIAIIARRANQINISLREELHNKLEEFASHTDSLEEINENKEKIEMKDFQDAVDRTIGGLEKKNKIISPEEKEIVAYHEAGHAVCGWFLEHADPLVKVTIVPRGVAALGYAQYLPKEQYLYTIEQLTDTMCMSLGGRAAEDIVFGRISTGAQSDLQHITKLAYSMVTNYGMNSKVGHISFYDPNNEYGFQKPYSEHTGQLIDEEVRKMIGDAFQKTRRLLVEKRDKLEIIAQELLSKEVLFQADLERLIGKRPFETKPIVNVIEPVEPLVENKENGKENLTEVVN